MPYIHHQTIRQSSFTAPTVMVLHLFLPFFLQTLVATGLFTVSIALPFRGRHRGGILQGVAFAEWLLSLSIMHLVLLHVFLRLTANFFLAPNNIPWHRGTAVCLPTHPLKDLSCFQVFGDYE